MSQVRAPMLADDLTFLTFCDFRCRTQQKISNHVFSWLLAKWSACLVISLPQKSFILEDRKSILWRWAVIIKRASSLIRPCSLDQNTSKMHAFPCWRQCCKELAIPLVLFLRAILRAVMIFTATQNLFPFSSLMLQSGIFSYFIATICSAHTSFWK